MNLIPDSAPPISRRVKAILFRVLDTTIKCDPGHDLRVRKMPPSTPHLPNAVVRLVPYCFRVFQCDTLQRPPREGWRKTTFAGDMQRVHHFSPDIKLELVRCRVAYPNGQRSPITRKPRDLPLVQLTFAA